MGQPGMQVHCVDNVEIFMIFYCAAYVDVAHYFELWGSSSDSTSHCLLRRRLSNKAMKKSVGVDDGDTAKRETKGEIALDPELVNVVTILEPFLSKRHTLIFAHDHIEVKATYIRFSRRRDGNFGVIFGRWTDFASLCKFKPKGVGMFEVISIEPVTILQV
ncbi:hypothetical protein AHAS_Ahas11G0092400 [Arachis hypogaea]